MRKPLSTDELELSLLSICPGKKTWPELVAKKGGSAAAVIERQNRNVKAIVVQDKSPVTVDLRCDRVSVLVNSYGVVTRVPTMG